MQIIVDEAKIAIIGLGYVGLPLAVEFAKYYPVIGLDIDCLRINELRKGYDRTLEIHGELLRSVLISEEIDQNLPAMKQSGLHLVDDPESLANCNYYIITLPTMVDTHKMPILAPLFKACKTVGRMLKKGDIVIYESTVYPGVTEEEFVPLLEVASGLKFNLDFFVGYSPERVNPGDKNHTVSNILKVTSGSTIETADKVDSLYRSIVTGGTFKATSIKVAEAAKVIENLQRDVNIALVNELSKIFNRLNIDTHDVLEAAGTKWNFLKFKPGLVGGHCIGIDSYYLAYKAQEVGYYPEILFASRRLNDSMGEYVAQQVIKLMVNKDIQIKNSRILVLGFTFKENCPDIRNTKVVDMLAALKQYQVRLLVYDPWVSPGEVAREYGWEAVSTLPEDDDFDVVILAVAHALFEGIDFDKICKKNRVIYDIKSVLPREKIDARL